MQYDLSRFVEAQRSDYQRALTEIRNGRKQTHWIWYVFPQLKGLGRSSTSWFYGFEDIGEAKAFLEDEYLGSHLREITAALLALQTDDIHTVMYSPDDIKLRSCMTLFRAVAPEEELFAQVLEKYFDGRGDRLTLKRLGMGE